MDKKMIGKMVLLPNGSPMDMLIEKIKNFG
jgi:hypothetical protein